MIKLENTVTPSADQWKAIILGARNPLNSWNKYDSFVCEPTGETVNEETCGKCPNHRDCKIYDTDSHFIVGNNDYDLMKRLCKAGTDHRKFMRMITVYVDITAPLYWWKELDTYKVGPVANSCSTMHKIHEREFALDDFSHEHLHPYVRQLLNNTVDDLNFWRNIYNNGGIVNNYDGTVDVFAPRDKHAWWQMIQLLPSSYNQKRTVMLNYEVLANMYRSRKNHKLDEWHVFCDWIKTLSYNELITGEFDEEARKLSDVKDTPKDQEI